MPSEALRTVKFTLFIRGPAIAIAASFNVLSVPTSIHICSYITKQQTAVFCYIDTTLTLQFAATTPRYPTFIQQMTSCTDGLEGVGGL